jgi:hypothetical protein
MRTLPRHLVLAAVVLTVCCAQRQAVSATVDLQKAAAEMTGQRSDESRLVHQNQRRANLRYIRPAAGSCRQQARAVFARAALPPTAPPPLALIHAEYPPSQFRLPPPAILA